MVDSLLQISALFTASGRAGSRAGAVLFLWHAGLRLIFLLFTLFVTKDLPSTCWNCFQGLCLKKSLAFRRVLMVKELLTLMGWVASLRAMRMARAVSCCDKYSLQSL